MNYRTFVKSLDIHHTRGGKGKGLRCNLVLDMYIGGNIHFYCKNEKGQLIHSKNEDVTTPAANSLGAVHIFIDVIDKMQKEILKRSKTKQF